MALLSHLLVQRKDGLLVDVVAGGDDQVSKVGQAILLRHTHKRLLHNPEVEFMNVQSSQVEVSGHNLQSSQT